MFIDTPQGIINTDNALMINYYKGGARLHYSSTYGLMAAGEEAVAALKALGAPWVHLSGCSLNTAYITRVENRRRTPQVVLGRHDLVVGLPQPEDVLRLLAHLEMGREVGEAGGETRAEAAGADPAQTPGKPAKKTKGAR